MPEMVEIPAGQSQAVLPISFTLGGTDNSNPLNMVEQYILPLTIYDGESSDYQANERKHYRKALLNVIPFNDYSGTYDGSQQKIYLENQGNAFTVTKHKAYVYNENTIFFYMGLRDVNYTDRQYYKLFVEFTNEKYEGKYKLRLWTDNGGPKGNNLGFLTETDIFGQTRLKQPVYTIQTEKDATKPYLEHIYYTLYMDYTFEDYTISPKNRLKYTVNGTLNMQRDLNTLIPDMDQQIQWD